MGMFRLALRDMLPCVKLQRFIIHLLQIITHTILSVWTNTWIHVYLYVKLALNCRTDLLLECVLYIFIQSLSFLRSLVFVELYLSCSCLKLLISNLPIQVVDLLYYGIILPLYGDFIALDYKGTFWRDC